MYALFTALCVVLAIRDAIAGYGEMEATSSSNTVTDTNLIARAAALGESLGIVTTNGEPEDTNMLVFRDEKRGGLDLFVDECLSRGVTNSIGIKELVGWATNVIDYYQRLESSEPRRNETNKQSNLVEASKIPESIFRIMQRIPACKYSYEMLPGKYWIMRPDAKPPEVYLGRNSTGQIDCIVISWYMYGVAVGPKSFRSTLEPPFYQRKIADGVYLFHGYK